MNKITKRYTNPSKPGSFLGLSGFKKNNSKNKDIENSLLKLNALTLHRNKRKNFKRCKTIVAGLDDEWQIDLIDVKNLKGSNFGNSYIFTCIDVFSKNAWAKAIKVKEAKECKRVFKQILDESKRKPNYLYLDGGNEFKGEFKSFCNEKNILLFPSKSKLKAAVVERFNRSLKEKMWRMFTYKSSLKEKKPKNFTNFLEDLVNSYNNSFNRAIKTTPAAVNKKNEEKIRNILYDEDIVINFKFKIGDYCRISEEKSLFDKGYTPNWSDNIYIISNLIPSNPPRYILKDLENIVYDYKFYYEEIQKVLFKEFPYDTFSIIKETSDNLLIEKINSNKQKEFVPRYKFENQLLK
jgi:hypothetical protein